MSQMRQELELARELIAERQFEKARLLLLKIKDDPTAQNWLKKLETLAPAAVAVLDTTTFEPWQYMALEVKRSYGIQYKVNGEAKPEWKDQPSYVPLNGLGRDGWELISFETASEFSLYLLKRPGTGAVQKVDVWDQ